MIQIIFLCLSDGVTLFDHLIPFRFRSEPKGTQDQRYFLIPFDYFRAVKEREGTDYFLCRGGMGNASSAVVPKLRDH